MNHRSEPGSRSAGIVHLHAELAQTRIDDRLREAQQYRRVAEARRARAAQPEARERHGLLARLVRGETARRVGRGAVRLATIGRGRVGPEEGQS